MRAALLSLLLVLLAAAPAGAAFSGSNGQIAYVDENGGLSVVDPFADDTAPQVIAQAAVATNAPDSQLTPQTAPQWSPDGTRIAYTAGIDNGEVPGKHSAVFVIDAIGGAPQQVSSPFPGKVNSCPTCKDGETSWDVSPVWKTDNTLAFVRWVAAEDDAQHEGQEGTTVRTVQVGGGGESVVKHFPNENQEAVMGLMWPATWSEPLIAHGSGAGFKLMGATSGTVFASPVGVTDFDVSPNGQQIAYGTIGAGGRRIVTIGLDGRQLESFNPGFHPEWVRFAPDGSRLILPGCADGGGCGLISHQLPDPDADVKPDENPNAFYAPVSPVDVKFPYLPGNRAAFDVQSQDLPVIYVPGFLGSEILCDGVNVWMPPIPKLQFAKMALQPDGRTNAGCAGARPTGKMVDTFLGKDVYGHGDDWLAAMNPPGGYASLGWDWRKRPQESLGKLDELVEKQLDTELAFKQNAHRVSMVGHSYGALLMRTYVDDEARAKKVARVLTVGAPYWGSPKPVFGLAFGIELPSFSAIDAMASNDDMRDFVRNAAGAYHLFPSDSYGGWLRRNGQPQDQAGVRSWLTGVAGNGGLLDEAWGTHRDHIDGFYDRGGKIDYRSVTGVGLLTIAGVNVMEPGRDGETLSAGVFYETGDGTVTGRSATQGPVGTDDPLGDDVHIQYRCGIEHMRQTADKVVQGAYARFLVDGHLPRKLPAADCKPEGQTIKVFHGLEVEPGSSLGQAEFEGKAQVLDLPEETLIVTNDSVPVDLEFSLQGKRFSITRQVGDKAGEEVVYGPVTGTVEIGRTVTVDGRPVDPVVTPPPAASPTPAAPAPTPAGPTPTPVVPKPTVTPARSCAKPKQALRRAKQAHRKVHSKRTRKRLAKAKRAYRRCVSPTRNP